MAYGLTPDHQGDNLHLGAHMTGNPVTATTGTHMPSAGISWGLIVGAVGVLALLWVLFKGVRI